MDALQALEGLAASTDADTAAAVPVDPNAPPPPPAPPSSLEQATDMVNTFAALATGYAPEAAEVWTADARAHAAMAIAPVMEKYGWSMTAIPPEITAAIVVGPLLYQTSKIVAGKMNAAKAQKATVTATERTEKADEPESAPGPAVHAQMDLYKVKK